MLTLCNFSFSSFISCIEMAYAFYDDSNRVSHFVTNNESGQFSYFIEAFGNM